LEAQSEQLSALSAQQLVPQSGKRSVLRPAQQLVKPSVLLSARLSVLPLVLASVAVLA
jgi:hypothetical protein